MMSKKTLKYLKLITLSGLTLVLIILFPEGEETRDQITSAVSTLANIAVIIGLIFAAKSFEEWKRKLEFERSINSISKCKRLLYDLAKDCFTYESQLKEMIEEVEASNSCNSSLGVLHKGLDGILEILEKSSEILPDATTPLTNKSISRVIDNLMNEITLIVNKGMAIHDSLEVELRNSLNSDETSETRYRNEKELISSTAKNLAKEITISRIVLDTVAELNKLEETL